MADLDILQTELDRKSPYCLDFKERNAPKLAQLRDRIRAKYRGLFRAKRKLEEQQKSGLRTQENVENDVKTF